MVKRSRDDVFLSPESKVPAIRPPTKPSGRGQMSTASTAQGTTSTDAWSYLKTVKQKFQGRGDKYTEFLEVMREFKAARIDPSQIILKVKELFEGDRDLVLGFNAFLPQGYKITLPPEDEPVPRKKQVQFEEALNYVNKIKTRFQGNRSVYDTFLNILDNLKDKKPITEVYQKISVLFKDHADLQVEFTNFLPDDSARTLVMSKDVRGSPLTMTGLSNIEKKPAVSCDAREQQIDHPDSEQRNLVEKGQKKNVGRDKNEWEHDDSLGQKRKSLRRDDSEQRNLVEKGQQKRVGLRDKSELEHDDSLGHKRKPLRSDDSVTDLFDQGMQDKVSSFREKVKERLQDSKTYKKFLDCIHSYGSESLTASQFQKLMTSLLGTQTDLMEECKDFITYVEKGFRPLKVEECEGDDHNTEDEDTNKDHNDNKDVPGQKLMKDKLLTKPIQELDLSNCDRCTPSYRLLPDNYPIPSVSGRTKIDAEVLNDRWVSVTSGSEDYSFNHMRRNQYEESLFLCEDDRFELDMLLNSVTATAERIEELLDNMNAHTNKRNSSFHIEDHLSVLNLRCIERLYGEHGLEVMDILRKNTPVALPVILSRLKQKQLEWESCRSDFNKVWAETYAKNHHKSLDHRSFWFKQQDPKNLSAKALLAEIKEMSGKDQNKDEMVRSIGAGYRQPIRPHMKFEYPDPDIQQDLYQLLKYSCREVCTSEQCDRVIKIWTNFVEPLIGVPSHPLEQVTPSAAGGISTNEENKTKAQKCDEEIESSTKSELEEGEISPNRNLESENACENVGVSADGEEFSEESPDENRDHDERDNKAESDREAKDVEDICDNARKIAFSDHSLQTAKPITKKTPTSLHFKKKNSEIFYGNDSFYLLFRLHQILYERMHSAKVLSSSPENKRRVLNDADQTDSYMRFKDALDSLLNRSSDNAKFEDECRATIGAESYILFSLDKLIHKLVKQLQTIASEEMDKKLLQLYEYERSRNPDKFCDSVYHENARFLLPRDDLYRIECVPSPTCLTIQLMKNEHNKPRAIMDLGFAAYLNDELLADVPVKNENPMIFLKRNKRRNSTGDEVSDLCKAMEGLICYNGLEIEIDCNTSKARYVLGTEDFLYRRRKGKKKTLSKGSSKILSAMDFPRE